MALPNLHTMLYKPLAILSHRYMGEMLGPLYSYLPSGNHAHNFIIVEWWEEIKWHHDSINVLLAAVHRFKEFTLLQHGKPQWVGFWDKYR